MLQRITNNNQNPFYPNTVSAFGHNLKLFTSSISTLSSVSSQGLSTKKTLSSTTDQSKTQNSSNQSSNNANQNYAIWRRVFGWTVPLVTTLLIGGISVVGGTAILETLAEPISIILDFESIATILVDSLFSVIPNAFKAIDKSKELFDAFSIKNVLFALSKLIPLFFILKTYLGNQFYSFKKEKEFQSKNYEKSVFQKVLDGEHSFAALAEATKAQITNLSGTSILSTPFNSVVWYLRAIACKGPLSDIGIVGFKDKESKTARLLKHSISTFLLATLCPFRGPKLSQDVSSGFSKFLNSSNNNSDN